jgi:bifunctional non-homologous end joining protein LigD
MTALRWVKPKIVVEVSFVEWTPDGLLRHPEFVGVRHDKSPPEIRREV